MGVGQSSERIPSREVEISPRVFANFQVYYDEDDRCADHNMLLDTHNIDECEEAPYHTWVRIIPDPDPSGWNEAISRAVSQVYEPDCPGGKPRRGECLLQTYLQLSYITPPSLSRITSLLYILS
jgi:hypothetical protein